MITSEQLTALFPAEGDLTGEHGRPEPVHQRHWLVGGELRPWTGRVQTVRSAICVRTGDGSLEQVELGSYPMGGIPEAEEALAAAVAAYDDGGGDWPTMTVAERIACMQDFTKQMVARRERDREPDHVGDRQEPAGLAKGVRPHGRLHPRDDRGAQGPRQRQLALPDRRRHHRPDPPHAARGRAVHGAVQLSAERDLRDADPGADHGQHHGVQAAEFGVLLFEPLLEAFRSAFPKGVINTVYGKGSEVVPRCWTPARSTCSP